MSEINLDQIRDLIRHQPLHALDWALPLVNEVARLRTIVDEQQQDLESERRRADRAERELDDLHRQHELPRDRRYYE